MSSSIVNCPQQQILQLAKGVQKMSRILPKRVNKQPIRSPSPDTACKNVIVRTNSPINQALSKSRLAKTSSTPYGKSFRTIEEYMEQIAQLQRKIELLSNQNNFLHRDNLKQRKEIDLLKEINFKSRQDIAHKSSRSILPDPDVLVEYQNKIGELSRELGRLNDLLIREKSRNQDLQKEIVYSSPKKIEQGSYSTPYTQLISKKKLDEIENKLNRQFDSQIYEYQLKVSSFLKDYDERITRLQKQQKQILNRLDETKKLATPNNNQKYSPEPTTSHKTLSDQYKRSSELFRQKKTQPFSFIDPAECQKCKTYLLQISQLQTQLNLKQFLSYHNKARNQVDVNAIIISLRDIKDTLLAREMSECISYFESIIQDMEKMNEKIESQMKEKKDAIETLMQKNSELEVQVFKLKKQNEILKVYTQEQQEEINQLKEILSHRNDKQQLKSRKSSQRMDESIIRRHILAAVSKIQSLQQNIANTVSK